jgi:hypothetical protein
MTTNKASNIIFDMKTIQELNFYYLVHFKSYHYSRLALLIIYLMKLQIIKVKYSTRLDLPVDNNVSLFDIESVKEYYQDKVYRRR